MRRAGRTRRAGGGGGGDICYLIKTTTDTCENGLLLGLVATRLMTHIIRHVQLA